MHGALSALAGMFAWHAGTERLCICAVYAVHAVRAVSQCVSLCCLGSKGCCDVACVII